jgi:hypothetical protein
MRIPRMACVLAACGAASCAPRERAPFGGEPDLRLPGVRQATGLTARDLDGDGRVDLAALSGRDARVAAVLNRGWFRDAALVTADAGVSASAMAIGDFNEDGELDVAVCHHDTEELWVLIGTGRWTFRPARTVAVPVVKPHAHMVVAADVNRDEHLDLLLAESEDYRAWVFLGDGRGGFVVAPEAPFATGRHPYIVATGDFDGDGNIDFATPDAVDKAVTVFLGNGRGGFRRAPGEAVTGFTAPLAIAFGDLTGDGVLDMAVGNNGERGVQVAVGDGRGGFRVGEVRDLEPQGPCLRPVIGDLNGDGRLDVVATATNGAKTFSYWLNLGDGEFGDAVALPCAEAANTISIADLNEDGLADLAVGTDLGDVTLIWFGRRR